MKTYSAILDYLYSVIDTVPVTINAVEVTWIWEMPNGKRYGLTTAHAISLQIIANRIGEHFGAGIIYPIDNIDNYIIL